MFRLAVNPFVGILVPARTKLIELGGDCQGKNGKRCESSEEHQNVSYEFWDIPANGHLLR